eukprot:1219850-Prymnesium_polylepis.1
MASRGCPIGGRGRKGREGDGERWAMARAVAMISQNRHGGRGAGGRASDGAGEGGGWLATTKRRWSLLLDMVFVVAEACVGARVGLRLASVASGRGGPTKSFQGHATSPTSLRTHTVRVRRPRRP